MIHLNRQIAEDVMPELTAQLQKTRQALRATFTVE